ncbi:MAG: hypothetical protein J1F20_08515 [Muribaculaceae bacterium]|nr:hypothetical protein [Muribaculaceae bacterium]
MAAKLSALSPQRQRFFTTLSSNGSKAASFVSPTAAKLPFCHSGRSLAADIKKISAGRRGLSAL